MNNEIMIQGNKRDAKQKNDANLLQSASFFCNKMRFPLVFPIFCIPIGFCQCVGLGYRWQQPQPAEKCDNSNSYSTNAVHELDIHE